MFISHHPKYLLRKTPEVLTYLKLSNDELISSSIAARLNGYCGIYGNFSDLEKEIDTFGLEDPALYEIKKIVRKGAPPIEP